MRHAVLAAAVAFRPINRVPATALARRVGTWVMAYLDRRRQLADREH